MDLTSSNDRKKLIDNIESNKNKGRKSKSFKANEIYSDRIKPFVISNLREQFDESTIREIPIVSSINICKRVVNQLACIYDDAPFRDFQDLTDDQKSVLWSIYDDGDFNKKLSRANKAYKNHDQCLLQVLPKNGKLTARILKPYQYDIIPSDTDPEEAMGYIISGYDNTYEKLDAADKPNPATGKESLSSSNANSYDTMSAIDDKDDNKRYLFWTNELNFVCDRKGNLVGEPMPNPIGRLPFIDISTEKDDFDFWVTASNQFSDFTVEFNTQYSLTAQVCKMQGFAQAFLKCNPDIMPERLEIGPNILLKLPVDANSGIDTEFGFANTGGDIMGNIAYIESLLAGFLSSLGIDPKTVTLKSEGTTYTSGLERLLAMIERVTASKEDYDYFEKVEYRLFELIKAWVKALSSSETLKQKYWLSSLNEDAEMTIEYQRPEMIMTKQDKLDLWQKEIDMGVNSPIGVIMERDNLDRENAEKEFQQYQIDNGLNIMVMNGNNGQDNTL